MHCRPRLAGSGHGSAPRAGTKSHCTPPPNAGSPDSASLVACLWGIGFQLLACFPSPHTPVFSLGTCPESLGKGTRLRRKEGVCWSLGTSELAGRFFLLACSEVEPSKLAVTQQIREQVRPEGRNQCHLLSQKVPALCSEGVPQEVEEVARCFCKRSSPTYMEDRQALLRYLSPTRRVEQRLLR